MFLYLSSHLPSPLSEKKVKKIFFKERKLLYNSYFAGTFYYLFRIIAEVKLPSQDSSKKKLYQVIIFPLEKTLVCLLAEISFQCCTIVTTWQNFLLSRKISEGNGETFVCTWTTKWLPGHVDWEKGKLLFPPGYNQSNDWGLLCIFLSRRKN